MQAFNGVSGELIISDYGSVDPEPVKQVADQIGARYVYTAGDPVWSRSRALNAGFAIAQGELLVSTDADMLFSPKSIRTIVETAREAEDCALFLQCRDLPQSMDDEFFSNHPTVDWVQLERAGRLRPRWGMGGMMAIPARGFEVIRGFDERLHTYGGEDLDFAQRARRAGYRTVWVDDPEVRMYHMWHPPTIRTVEQTEAGREAVAFNKQVVYKDKTFTRNTLAWNWKPKGAAPLVSIVFATKNRADLLVEAIRSVLIQSVQDFEVIVVDDGSDDDSTQVAVESFNDNRIRYFKQPSEGISVARNLALAETRGYFTAVMDDDDIMPPQRLEWQLESITADHVGSAGSFVNFDDETGELHLIVSRLPTIAQAAEKGGAPGHGTWLIRTDVMRSIRYDETLTSGVDNNFFLRLLRSGYKIAHCGKPVLLRRRHKSQVSVVDNSNQGDAAKQALQYFNFGLGKWHLKQLAEEAKELSYPQIGEKADYIRSVQSYLPDSLVRRNATVRVTDDIKFLPRFDGSPYFQRLSRDGLTLSARLTVLNASYSDLVYLMSLGRDLEAELVESENDALSPKTQAGWVLSALEDYLEQTPTGEAVSIHRNNESFNGEVHRGVNYEMISGEVTESINICRHEIGDAVEVPVPWVVYGRTAKEFWS